MNEQLQTQEEALSAALWADALRYARPLEEER